MIRITDMRGDLKAVGLRARGTWLFIVTTCRQLGYIVAAHYRRHSLFSLLLT